ncbi:MAG: YceI family protein [Hyphomicrobiaceae bacterium]
MTRSEDPPAFRPAIRAGTAGKVLILAALAMCHLLGPAAGTEKIVLDSRQLTIRFEVRSFGVWSVAGRFAEARGEIAFDPTEPTRSQVRVVARTPSIDTASAARDAALRSTHFFDTERHPLLTFESTQITLMDRTTGTVTGNLRMIGVSKPIRLTFELRRDGGPTQQIGAGRFQASGMLRRSEWGMTAFIPTISDEVRLEIEAHLSP